MKKNLILTILATLGVVGIMKFGGIVVSDPIVATISGKDLTAIQYQTLKTDLKAKVSNRNKVKLINTDVQKWTEIVNKEIKKCVLTNVDMTKIVDIINNNCL